MSGLFYKDFVLVRGRILITAAAVYLLAISGIGFLSLQIQEVQMFMILFIQLFILIFVFGVWSFLLPAIMGYEEGRNRINYLLAAPISIKEYVVSKYLFILIADYAAVSVLVIAVFFGDAFCSMEICRQQLTLVQGMIFAVFQTVLFMAMIDFPIGFAFGQSVGQAVKNLFLAVLFFAVILYLLLGDLRVLQKISLESILGFMEKNKEVFICVEALSPCICLGCYYLSYRLSVNLLRRRIEGGYGR